MIPRLSPFIYKDVGGGGRRQPVTIATLSHKTPPATFVSRSGKKKQTRNTKYTSSCQRMREDLGVHVRAYVHAYMHVRAASPVAPTRPRFSVRPHADAHIYTLALTTLLNPISPARRGAARSGAALRTPSMSAFESRQNNQLAAAESGANESVSSGGR